MPHTWLNQFPRIPGIWNRNSVSRALRQGDLPTAAQIALNKPLDTTFSGRRDLRRLTSALIREARSRSERGDLPGAWDAIATVREIALASDRQKISRETNTLVELTIKAANELLRLSKSSAALELVKGLRAENVRHSLADKIQRTAELIEQGEDAAVHGDFQSAIDLLSRAHDQRPDLEFLSSRIATCQLHGSELNRLTKKLESAIGNRHRTEVENLCRRILVLAPEYPAAIDAYRLMAGGSMSRDRQPVTVGEANQPAAACPVSREPDQTKNQRRLNSLDSDDVDSDRRDRSQPVGQTAKRDQENESGGLSTTTGTERRSRIGTSVHTQENETGSRENRCKPFIIWIDAVGGFLVCPGMSNVIGQAVPNANIQIPMTGDLKRRHAKFEPLSGEHAIHPFGTVILDGRKIEDRTILKSGQEISFDNSIRMKYRKSHPLSSTATLEFLSRHRTHPWSDGILLASGPVILGADSKSHVVCKHLSAPMMLFQRDGHWMIRSSGRIAIDSVGHDGEGPLELTSTVVTENLSLTLEPFSI